MKNEINISSDTSLRQILLVILWNLIPAEASKAWTREQMLLAGATQEELEKFGI